MTGSSTECDVIVVGGGPAGMSAALVLGRCCRRVVLYDDAHPRNAASDGVKGYLGRHGISPAELRDVGRRELAPYDVRVRDRTVVAARKDGDSFEVADSAGETVRGRMLLLAVGVRDRLPSRPGLAALWGRGVFACAYCDGWEHRNRRLAAFGHGPAAVELALGLTAWSRDVVLLADGVGLAPEDAARLRRNEVRIALEPVVAFEPADARLAGVILGSGERLALDAVFLHFGQREPCSLATMLGCTMDEAGAAETFEKQRTGVPGLYVAGDASHDVKLAIIAAAHGARAAHDIHQALRKADTR